MSSPLDLFVIGGGSGGVRAARIAAGHGASVAIAEHYKWGGTCVVRGCVPKKLLVFASEVSGQLQDAKGFGWTIGDAQVDWPTLIGRVQQETMRLSGLYAGTLGKHGVTQYTGTARLHDANTVEINGQLVTAKNILIAALLILTVIVVLQNTEAVETKLLFATITMPRALLLLITLASGTVIGLLLGTELSKLGGKGA